MVIPQSLVDCVISLLDEAGFELQAPELGPFSLLRFLADELISLAESELHLVLELFRLFAVVLWASAQFDSSVCPLFVISRPRS